MNEPQYLKLFGIMFPKIESATVIVSGDLRSMWDALNGINDHFYNAI